MIDCISFRISLENIPFSWWRHHWRQKTAILIGFCSTLKVFVRLGSISCHIFIVPHLYRATPLSCHIFIVPHIYRATPLYILPHLYRATSAVTCCLIWRTHLFRHLLRQARGPGTWLNTNPGGTEHIIHENQRLSIYNTYVQWIL